ncbi:hypothetical protein IFR05_008435 [Cadophora sp. M221]|nr:hypothetical protein IFR05_008435 [Cadophora sp. M221]
MPPKETRTASSSNPSLKIREALADRITLKYANSRFDDSENPFLPDGCLDSLVTRKSIVEELRDKELTPEEEERVLHKDDQTVVDYVLSEGRKVFAITIISGLRGYDLNEAMWGFYENDINDASLPIKNTVIADGVEGFPGSVWGSARRHVFFQEQWRFLAPVFSKENPAPDLKPHHILPFIRKGKSISEGASGDVYEVGIHPAHLPEAKADADGNVPRLAIKEFVIPTGNKEFQEDALKVWGDEIYTLDKVERHENLIEKIAAIKRGQQHCLMFLWAEGGNLREFWQDFPRRMSASLVKDIISQLRGMAEVLEILHNPKGTFHSRHGDIKPENILRFPGPDESRIGLFKISDLGSAKHHAVVTRLRGQTAGGRWATKVYEPPESMTNKLGATPRLYDIWSMGCVTLEWIIWLLYGNEELAEFNTRVKDSSGDPEPFFICQEVEEVKEGSSTIRYVAHIHPAVQGCFQDLSNDMECNNDTALCSLLDIVMNKLLVVELPVEKEASPSSGPEFSLNIEDSNDPTPRAARTRATAKEFVQALDGILKHKNASSDNYWFTGQTREGARLPGTVTRIQEAITADNSTLLSPGWKTISGQSPTSHRLKDHSSSLSGGNFLKVKTSPIQDIQDLSDDWLYPVDNVFATQFLEDTGTTVEPPNASNSSRLCDKCEKMDFWSTQFRIRDSYSDLEVNSKTCDFCKLRWDVSKHLDPREYPFISFERIDSMFMMNDGNSPVLTIYRTKELNTRIPIQIGFPKLAPVGSQPHFQILRNWLKNCDTHHEKFKCKHIRSNFLPTRLLDVGEVGSTTIQLYETQKTDSLDYIALSHPWGTKPPLFCTYPNNVEDHKKGIDVATLTSTFQDAVQTTQELGFRYLWIDSICIIQGPDGDFGREAQHMESVFSSAYCVLAASSASGQSSGFLNKRDDRDFVTFHREDESPFYVCRFIDDFNQHVLQGKLSKRGWVMQERVLAHRTIYFTSKQTYWECGEAVRCETLTKMENKLASFLGDPNFPSKITDKLTSKGQRIIFYQDMYKQYSRLLFTRWEDRPIAIAGLEKRLLYDLRTRGGFGVFDDGQSLLRRSLLWQRGKDDYGKLEDPLRRIEFPKERNTRMPSWSWMAYEGKIDFLEMRLGGIEWQNDEIRSPWNDQVPRSMDPAAPAPGIELAAVARDFDGKALGVHIIHDNPKNGSLPLKCIVMGRRKEKERVEDTIHYALFITQKGEAGNSYERVGVGFMHGRSIDLKGPGVVVKVS